LWPGGCHFNHRSEFGLAYRKVEKTERFLRQNRRAGRDAVHANAPVTHPNNACRDLVGDMRI